MHEITSIHRSILGSSNRLPQQIIKTNALKKSSKELRFEEIKKARLLAGLSTQAGYAQINDLLSGTALLL
jgi:hypothetical protein